MMKLNMNVKRNKKRNKTARTLADIRSIPKWARKKLEFTCDVVEFDYKSITNFVRLDTIQMRQQSFTPEIDLNAVTKWQD